MCMPTVMVNVVSVCLLAQSILYVNVYQLAESVLFVHAYCHGQCCKCVPTGRMKQLESKFCMYMFTYCQSRFNMCVCLLAESVFVCASNDSPFHQKK